MALEEALLRALPGRMLQRHPTFRSLSWYDTMRPLRRLPAVFAGCTLVLVAFGAGCGDNTLAPAGSAVGTYVLRSIGGQALPAPVLGAVQPPSTIVSATLTLASDGELALREVVQPAIADAAGNTPAPDTTTQTGTWAVAGAAVTLTFPTTATPPQVVTQSGVLSGGTTLTVTVNTRTVQTWVWQK